MLVAVFRTWSIACVGTGWILLVTIQAFLKLSHSSRSCNRRQASTGVYGSPLSVTANGATGASGRERQERNANTIMNYELQIMNYKISRTFLDAVDSESVQRAA